MAGKASLPGPKNYYRPKLRNRVITFTMTAVGHKALEKLLRESDKSRADILEEAVRKMAGFPVA